MLFFPAPEAEQLAPVVVHFVWVQLDIYRFISGQTNNIALSLAFDTITTSRFRDTRTNATIYSPVVAIHGKHLQGEHCGWGAIDLELSGGCDNCIACGPPNGRVLCQQAE